MSAARAPGMLRADLMRSETLFPLALALAALLLVPSPASAYERQWHAGADLGTLGAWSGVGMGVSSGVHLSYGVRDYLDLTGAIDVSYHPSSAALISTGALGVRFVFDVLQVVPHLGLQAGVGDVAIVGSGCAVGCNAARFDLALPFGVDYQLSRSFTLGVAGKFQLLLANGPATPMLGVFARAVYVWGY